MFLWRRAAKTTMTARFAQWLRSLKRSPAAREASAHPTGDGATRGVRPRLYVVPGRPSGTTPTR